MELDLKFLVELLGKSPSDYLHSDNPSIPNRIETELADELHSHAPVIFQYESNWYVIESRYNTDTGYFSLIMEKGMLYE